MTCYQVSLTLFHLVPSLRKDTLYSGTGSHSNYEHDYCNGCTSHSLHQCQQVQRSHQTVIWCHKNQPTGSCSQHQWRHSSHYQTSFLTTYNTVLYDVGGVTHPGLIEIRFLPSFKNSKLLFSASFSMLILSLVFKSSLIMVNCFSWCAKLE